MNKNQNASLPFVCYWNTSIPILSTNRHRSTRFTIFPTTSEFIIELSVVTSFESKLRLWLSEGDNSTCFDLNVEVKFTNGTKNFTLKDFKGISCDFGTFNIYTLLSVTCTLSKSQITEKPAQATGPNNNTVQTRIPKIVKQESTIKEQVRSKGLAALSKDFKDLFLNAQHSDLNIQVGNQNYPVHKAVILTRCPIFQGMVKSQENKDYISIADCEQSTFNNFLVYLYSGQIDVISMENAFELYQMSKRYRMKEFESDCVNFILDKLTVSKACKIIVLSKKYGETKFINQATAFFVENAKDILASSDWKDFLKNNPIEANEIFMKMFDKASKK